MQAQTCLLLILTSSCLGLRDQRSLVNTFPFNAQEHQHEHHQHQDHHHQQQPQDFGLETAFANRESKQVC